MKTLCIKNSKENLPLAKKARKLSIVLSKEEVDKMIGSTNNLKHKLVMMFLYYAELRLDEVRNLRWEDLDLDRETIHIQKNERRKGEGRLPPSNVEGVIEYLWENREGLVFCPSGMGNTT
jgi:integrase